MFTPRGHCRTFMILGLTFSASVAQAQVTLDGTLGPAGPLSGPNYAIPAEVGQQHGGNLFHSFGQFSIQQGESATFSGPNSVNNIIGRVTGGQASTIDGLLRSTIPGANLYLLNPAGLLFGPNAALDVSGSFHASTADYLRLGEGGRFDALMPGNSVLTVAPVEAFGFLGEMPGRIDINGSYLHGAEGQTLSLIGGDITLTNATVYAPAGRLNVAAVGSAGEAIPTDTDLVMQGFGRLGTLTMARDPDAPRETVDMGENFAEVPLGDLDTSGEGGGALFIRGGEWVSRGGWVFADTYGAQAGRDVNVQIAGGMHLTNGALLTAATLSQGDAGNVNLTIADILTVQNGGFISAGTWGEGDAGDVTVSAGNLLVDGMGSETFTGLASSAEDGSTGAGGSVNLTLTDTLTVQNGGFISAGTWGEGDAGDVTVS
ncbi:MAG: filamentous hemagglutinin N-terminal domain-containing protein, partial [Candidatus Competibacteraceae bacterium]|nr:filamentous hemagglutinin N-terminal domain-containing protein [Candidatus Competibacteraceae bacterium]